MGLLDDAVMLGGQMVYYKVKNDHRAKAFTKWAETHQFSFCKKPAEYQGEIMQMPTANPDAAKARGGRSLSAKAMMAHRICLLYTSPSPRDVEESRMPSSA